MIKQTLALLVAASMVLLVRPAIAQGTPSSEPPAERDVCSESFEKAQEEMRPNQAESKLLLARESLWSCLRSNCKSWMVSDCSKWLAEVEARIPSVVFLAKDTSGHDLTNVRVTKKDGTAVVESLDGRAVEIEPGLRDFVFVSADGTRVERRALVREGEKAQVITATFAGAGGGNETKPVEPVAPPPPPVGRETPTLRYIGYGSAGLGVVGLAVGTIFGLSAISKKSSECDALGQCTPGTRDSLSSLTSISTVGFIAGAALAAAGVTLILVSPSPSRRVGARVSANGLTLGGQW